MATTYDITTKNGDTYPGAVFTITVNDSPLNLTGYSAQMQVRATRSTAAIIDISNGSGLTFSDAANGELTIDAQIFDSTPGTYLYDIELTSGAGVVKTYISGKFVLTEDITYV